MLCKNCNTSLQVHDDFCRSCGAKVIRNRLTLKNLFEHFSEQFLNYDNRFLQTIKYLLIKPEDVICSYVDGVRKKYINPISFFAISLTISGLYFFIVQKFFPDAMDFSQMYADENTQKISSSVSNSITDYNSLFYFVFIPILALISWLLFYKNKFNFTEHVVIYLYTMSLGSMVASTISIIVLIITPEYFLWTSIFINILLFLFHCYLLKRVFDLTLTQIVIKTILFIIIFTILYIIFSVLVFFAVIFFTDMSLQDFVPKK